MCSRSSTNGCLWERELNRERTGGGGCQAVLSCYPWQLEQGNKHGWRGRIRVGTGENPVIIGTCQLPLKRLKLALGQVLFGLNSMSPNFELVGHLLKSGRFCNCLGRRRDILETGKSEARCQPEEERRRFTEWPQLVRPPCRRHWRHLRVKQWAGPHLAWNCIVVCASCPLENKLLVRTLKTDL